MILIADDHALYRNSVKHWLSSCDCGLAIETTANAKDTIAFIQSNEQLKLLMLDLCMPGMKGVTTIREIHEHWPTLPILVVSGKDDPALIKSCIDAGSAGFLPKTSDGEQMLEAINQLMAGRCFIPQNIMNSIVLKFSKKQESILRLLAKGLGNREIANHIHLSEGTVKQYISDILSKLEVDNRVQAGIRARQIFGLNE